MLDRQSVARDLPGIRILCDEPMSRHTSFEIGGSADLMLVPEDLDQLQSCINYCQTKKLSMFLLGGGTNILVSDRGVRGVVIKLTSLSGVRIDGCTLHAQAGAEVAAVAEEAAKHNLSGLEFLYGMPGTIGGAAWMNARCYGGEMSEKLVRAQVLSFSGTLNDLTCRPKDFSYKKSPFQALEGCIVELELQLDAGDPKEIQQKMQANLEDRRSKGHFRAPSAGSLFKNDRRFGAPTGKILDDLGLRGTISGGAAIAPFHGNIFINNGGATANDVFSLMVKAIQAAQKERHIELEPEVRLVGEWLPEELEQLKA